MRKIYGMMSFVSMLFMVGAAGSMYAGEIGPFECLVRGSVASIAMFFFASISGVFCENSRR